MGCNPVLSGNCFDCGTHYSMFEGKCPKCGQRWGTATMKTDLFKTPLADYFWRVLEVFGLVAALILMWPIKAVHFAWSVLVECRGIVEGNQSFDFLGYLKFWSWDWNDDESDV